MANDLLTPKQLHTLEKYGISCEGSINAILEDINNKILEVGYNEGYMTNAAGDELQALFDELFPLGEDEYE